MQPDGYTLREHLLNGARQRRDYSALAMPELPPGCAHVWNTYNELAAGRSAMGGGIPPSEIVAWQQLHGVVLSPWELDTVHAIDRAVQAVMDKQQAAERARAAAAQQGKK